jgi:hypothetical protein
MKRITRERPRIDRIACPWLIARFVDPEPEFLYVAKDTVTRTASEVGAVPFDVEGVELGHHGDKCSFDAFLERYGLRDPALEKVALIVRAADTGRPEMANEAFGLLALSKGLALNFPDDHEMLRHGLVLYDALYAWCAGKPVSPKRPAARRAPR